MIAGAGMKGFNRAKLFSAFASVVATTALLAVNAFAQSGGGGGGPASVYNFNGNYHVGFESPEGWGLKYFASASLLSGLQPPEPREGHHVGSVSVGFELGWLPSLDAGQRQIGFKGTTPEDLNKAPIFARPVVRIGLPDK